MAEYMNGLIAEKRRRPGDSLLDCLISARDRNDHLSEEELVSLAVLLLAAGPETTTSFLSNVVLTQLQHPAELERVREKPENVPASLDELLRFASPVNTATVAAQPPPRLWLHLRSPTGLSVPAQPIPPLPTGQHPTHYRDELASAPFIARSDSRPDQRKPSDQKRQTAAF